MPTTNRKKQEGRDTAVQGTNDSSVVSKASAAAQGYFNDAFIQHFVCKVVRRAPLINRGYYVRWRAVDHCVRRFLQVTESCPKRQILSLGAGFDSLYFRLHVEKALTKTVVFEVDFPDVARHKASFITHNNTLRGMLDEHLLPPTGALHVQSGQYRLLGSDIRQESQVKEALGSAGLDWESPTLVLSEVVLTYMETNWSDEVIKWAAKLLPQSLFVLYEQIHPCDPFGRIMQEHFQKLNSTLHALRQYPDTAAQRQRFLEKGWDQCLCLDVNEFFFGLVPEEERRRVESLEPFDEYEEWHQKCSHYFILTASRGSSAAQALLSAPPVSALSPVVPSWSCSLLTVETVSVCLGGLGMASTTVSPGLVLITGGSRREGRRSAIQVLHRSPSGWGSWNVEPSADVGVRLYHTVTSYPGGGAVVFGGRSSPLKSVSSMFKVNLDLRDLPENGDAVKLCVEQMFCTGEEPAPRWRHTATVFQHKGEHFLFVFGGKNESKAALGDAHFLSLQQQHWTQIPIEGAAPDARHSHSACSYGGGVLVFGGLDTRGQPLGDLFLLKPTDGGFMWESVKIQPPAVPRYSHSSRVIGEKLVVVGGVWLHADNVPGVTVIDLITKISTDFQLDLSSVPWPLMLHSFCCELTDSAEPKLILIGGGGNCFSFGTHFNLQPVTVALGAALG